MLESLLVRSCHASTAGANGFSRACSITENGGQLPQALGVLKNLGSGYLRADDVRRNGTFGTNLFTGCLPTGVVNHVDKHVDKRFMPQRNTRDDVAWIGAN